MKSALIPSEEFQVSEISLSYNPKVKASQRRQITCPRDAYNLLIGNWDNGKIQFVEQFKVVMLSNTNRVLGIYELSTGGLTATVADARLIFSAALLANASQIILAHNHPSGGLRPSQADLGLTENIKQAGKVLNIKVIEHLILTAEGYLSMADEGLL